MSLEKLGRGRELAEWIIRGYLYKMREIDLLAQQRMSRTMRVAAFAVVTTGKYLKESFSPQKEETRI